MSTNCPIFVRVLCMPLCKVPLTDGFGHVTWCGSWDVNREDDNGGLEGAYTLMFAFTHLLKHETAIFRSPGLFNSCKRDHMKQR